MFTYLAYIALGFLPSTIWLIFYLRKDIHPEPRRQIIKIFLYGVFIAPVAALLEFALLWLTNPSFEYREIIILLLGSSTGWRAVISAALFAPAVEEYLKYKIIKDKILKNSDFDEPLDAMLYLIIGALGFAAAENTIAIVQHPMLPIEDALATISSRFVSATFLHALASGIVGYFLAKSFFHPAKRFLLITYGLTLAIVFHGGYNYLISIGNKIPGATMLVIPLLLVMALFVSLGFNRLKKQLSVCEISNKN